MFENLVDESVDTAVKDYLHEQYMTHDVEKDEGRVVSTIVKEYPDMFKIIVYKEPYRLPNQTVIPGTKKQKTKKTNDHESIHRSVRRTKSVVSDLVLSNSFDLFCTFTFDRRKVDRDDVNRCKFIMTMWLHRQREKSPDMQYLIVPEYHKKCTDCSINRRDYCRHDKPIHFHALIKNYNGKLKYSGKMQKGRKVYNLPGYRAGFSTAVEIDHNYMAVASYIQKYITKDMPLIPGKKRYWVSRGLIRPITHVNGFHYLKNKFVLMHHVHENDDYNIYRALKAV